MEEAYLLRAVADLRVRSSLDEDDVDAAIALADGEPELAKCRRCGAMVRQTAEAIEAHVCDPK